MNIKQAKEYIKDSVSLYLKKDEFGEYRVPVARQRPIFMVGAPGIGKTAIMEQIAQELGIALVAYSMTHHTRQSALGLPFIEKRFFGGRECAVSEYTMSEIIAAIYDTMERSCMKEGILFLDEINCVSETLAPSMLQFLQFKTFGRHQVPEGWVIVTAGNPPEYNKSVREFDVVTMDRLKVLSVEADFRIWKEYAMERGIHSAVISFLDLKKEYFYMMEMTAQGRSFVTARGWEDLAEILKLYEEDGLKVDESLVEQYVRNPKVVKEFTAYYDLHQKYKKDYRIEEILAGKSSAQAAARAKEAPFDERLSLLGMLIDKVQAEMKDIMERTEYLKDLRIPLKGIQEKLQAGVVPRAEVQEFLELQVEARRRTLQNMQAGGSLSNEDQRKHRRVIRFLDECRRKLFLGEWEEAQTGEEVYEEIKRKYNSDVTVMKGDTARMGERLHHLFSFAEAAFAGGNEMLILVTEMTVGKYSAAYLANFGCEDYTRHNQELLISERQNDLQAKIAAIGL